jgi:CubicO group peptidase (beta-lactamase class C family)
MHSFARAAFVTLTSLVLLPAQEAPPAADLGAKVDRIFRACQKPGEPGAVVLVGRGTDILLQRAYGLADLERDVPLSVESVLDIGSTSKQFTAACVLLLAQDGKLSLADPVKQHVPELPACCDGITLRHLVLHTSGIPDYIGLMLEGGVEVEDRTTAHEALASLGKVTALEFPFGSKWSYSNSNYFLLAEVVERVAERPLHEFAAERIFTPLGMAQTHIHADATQLVPKRALSYGKGRRGEWVWNFSNWEQTGDGAVFTTVGDLFRWSQNFQSGQVGGAALLEAMAQQGSLDDGTVIAYGMGLMTSEVDGRRVVSHGGAWAGYRAEMLRIPSEGLVVICLCNRDDVDPSGLGLRVARAVLQ